MFLCARYSTAALAGPPPSNQRPDACSERLRKLHFFTSKALHEKLGDRCFAR